MKICLSPHLGVIFMTLPFRDEEWKEKIEYVLNTADYIITVSNSNLKCINKLNVKTPVKVIPNGFNSNLSYPKDPAEIFTHGVAWC